MLYLKIQKTWTIIIGNTNTNTNETNNNNGANTVSWIITTVVPLVAVTRYFFLHLRSRDRPLFNND